MKLRFKLILAFLLLSVVPLSGVIVYSYINSQRAVRQAMEAEVQMMADEMSRRLEGVRNDLIRPMDRLSQLPFRTFVGGKGPSPHLQRDPVLAELMKRMGKEDVPFDSLEFVRRPPDTRDLQGTANPPKGPPAEACDDATVLVARVQESVGEHPAELQSVHATN